jgi:hypothetical protein
MKLFHIGGEWKQVFLAELFQHHANMELELDIIGNN